MSMSLKYEPASEDALPHGGVLGFRCLGYPRVMWPNLHRTSPSSQLRGAVWLLMKWSYSPRGSRGLQRRENLYGTYDVGP
jgi:hypothetical protein